MKNIGQYLAAGALALATSGCMTPTPANTNSRLIFDGEEYSGTTKSQNENYLVKASEKNVSYSADLTGKAKKKADIEKAFYAIEPAKVNGKVITYVNLNKIKDEDLENIRTGRKTLEQVLGASETIPGVGKLRAFKYGGERFYLLYGKDTKANWDEDGNVSLYGTFVKIGNELTQEEFDKSTPKGKVKATAVQTPKEQEALEGEPKAVEPVVSPKVAPVPQKPVEAK